MASLRRFPRNANVQTIGPALLYVNVKWCPYCTEARPTMEKVSGVLGSVVPVYSIDGDERPDLMEALGAKSFPTIIYVSEGGARYVFKGDRTLDAITGFVCRMSTGYEFCRKR